MPGGEDDFDFSDNEAPLEVDEEDDDFAPAVEKKRDEFQVLSLKEMESAMQTLIADVADTLDVSPTKASMLLRTNNWNKEKLVLAYLENGPRLEEKTGVQFLSIHLPVASGPAACRICDETVKPADTYAMGCGHRFCKDCWVSYLVEKLTRGKEALSAHCPFPRCPALIDDDTFNALLRGPEKAQFRRYLVRAYIEDSSGMRWCPAAGCDNALKAPGGTLNVMCTCGFSFCFKCNEETHAPVTCESLQIWLDKCRNESETAHWIIANTKRCPKCSVRIEKNHGCNHITCRTCKHEFCWICMGVWSEHGNHTGGYYKCNRYDPKNKKNAATATSVEKAKQDHDRYLHYYQRYHTHDQSKKFAEKLRKATEQRMAELQGKSGSRSWMDVQFLKGAVEQVLQCRRVLKYTYVFGYFLHDGQQNKEQERNLFEYLQEQLEKTTEKLSELSEVPVDKLDQAEVTNYTRVTKQFMQNLLDGIANGLTSAST